MFTSWSRRWLIYDGLNGPAYAAPPLTCLGRFAIGHEARRNRAEMGDSSTFDRCRPGKWIAERQKPRHRSNELQCMRNSDRNAKSIPAGRIKFQA